MLFAARRTGRVLKMRSAEGPFRTTEDPGACPSGAPGDLRCSSAVFMMLPVHAALQG